MSGSWLGTAFAVAALLMFSTNIILTKLAMSRLAIDVGFVVNVAVNVLFGALAFAIELALRRAALEWDARAFVLFVLSGVFTTYLGRWFFFESVARLGPARASTFQVSSPLFIALVAWIVLGERLSATVVTAMVIVVVGLGLVSAGPSSFRSQQADAARGRRGAGHEPARVRIVAMLRSGLVLGLASSIAYAIGNVLRSVAIHRWQEPVLGALLGALGGIVLHFSVNPAARRLAAAIRSSDRRGLALYAGCGTLTIAGQILTIASMSYIPVSIAALITLCSPILVIPASHLLFRSEAGVTPRVVLGSALALVGIAVVVSR